MKSIMRLFPLLMILLALPMLLHWLAADASSEPTIPDSPPPSAPDWSDPVIVSFYQSQNAKRPSIAAAPDGNKVMVAFKFQLDSQHENDNDPYYIESSDNGATWPFPPGGNGPLPIHNSPGQDSDSNQVSIIYDGNSNAHAVWVEDRDLVYAPKNIWPTNATTNPPRFIAVASVQGTGVADPMILSNEGETLDIIWAEDKGGKPQHLPCTFQRWGRHLAGERIS